MKIKTFMVLGCAMALAGCNSGNPSSSVQARKWKTQQVETSDAMISTLYSASIQGRQDIEIRPQVSGTITELRVAEGQKVHNGQTLFVIDPVPYRAALAQATASVKAAKAAEATARLNYESRQRLFAEKVISDYELQTARNSLLDAEAQTALSEAAELNARNNLSYTEVKSPSDGVVGVLPYRRGSLVGPDISQPLTTVSDNSEMYVYFSMDENRLLAFMREYGSMDETLKNMEGIGLVLSDGSEYAEQGRIESVSGVIDRSTGSVTFRAVFPNPKKLLHSGATGSVRIPSQYKGIIQIPQTATIALQDKILVYKVVDGKAVSTLVSVEANNDGREYIVRDGLQKGDVIIAEGAGLVREGMEIE